MSVDLVQVISIYGLGALALVVAVYYAIQVNRLYGRVVILQESLNTHLKDCKETNAEARNDRKDLHSRIGDVDKRLGEVREDVGYLRGKHSMAKS